MATDELSIDVDAELSSVELADAPPAEPAEELDPASDETDETPDDESDEDILEVTANGQTHRVNLRNTDEVKKLLSAGLGVKRMASDVGKIKQENRRLALELKQAESLREKAAIWEKLEALRDDEDELFRVVSGGKSLDDVVNARLAKKTAWEDATPEERMQMERDEREAALLRRIERMEQAAKAEKEEAQRLKETAEEKQAHAVAYSEYKSVFKALESKDPETAQDLWELGMARVARMVKKNEEDRELDPSIPEIELTPDLFRRQFQVAATRWGYDAKSKAKKHVAETLAKKSKVAATKAGAAATKNYRSTRVDSDEFTNLSPTKIFDKLFKK